MGAFAFRTGSSFLSCQCGQRTWYGQSMKRALPYLAVAAVVGCGGATTAFTRTGPTLAAQPKGCEFSVVRESPTAPSKELGTIAIKYQKQMDWIYDESAFKRKVRANVCQSGGDTVVAHINDNGLYMSATVLTTKAIPVTTPSPAVASSEPESTPPAAPPPAETTTAPDKRTQAQAAATPAKKAAATPAKKEEAAKVDDTAKAASGKKRSKKGVSAKKDEDIRGKDGKVDIDKLL
jgi:hypothetical protein